jgi:hypothetical protein
MNLPETENALVLRTDFSDDAAWDALCEAIRKPEAEFGFQAYVDAVSDPAFAGLAVIQLLALIPPEWNHTFFFVVDRMAIEHPDHPILVIDAWEQRGRTFRVIPAEMWSVENNLSLANMDFEDFSDSADSDGILRSFPKT